MAIILEPDYNPQFIPKAERRIRDSGAYARTKIEAFMRYANSAQKVFKGNKGWISRGRAVAGKLVYLEPFSGPGWNLFRETKELVKGTPLRAIEELKDFDIFIFNEREKEILDSLYSELVDLGIREAVSPVVHLFLGDANELMDKIPDVLAGYPADAWYPHMGIAAVDPEGLHFRWGSVEKLAQLRLDFVNMVATQLDLVRNALNAGAQTHIELWLGEPPNGRSPAQLIERYERRLKEVAKYQWQHGVSTSPIPGDEYIWVEGEYHLIFASHCTTKVASNIWKGVCKHTRRDQGPSLFD